MTGEAPAAPSGLAGVEPQPGIAKPDPVLVADSVRRSFGGVVAVDVNHLEIARGCITGLIGPNGAGKTTLFNVLTGFEAADRGTWSFDGTAVTGHPPHRLAASGLVRTFQLTKVLRRMTVLDNMKLAAPGQRGERLLGSFARWRWRLDEAAIEARATELLEQFGLTRMRHEYAGTLSGGQRKLLEIARSLMVSPTLVMLDEPLAGVNPALAQSILEPLRDLPARGTTVLFIEHEIDVVMDVSDWVVCMAEGRVIAEGPPRAVRTDEAVIDAYLGTRHAHGSSPGGSSPCGRGPLPQPPLPGGAGP